MDMEAAVILRLVDRLSGPATKVANNLRKVFDDAAKRSGVTAAQALSLPELNKAVEAAERRVALAQSRVMGAVAKAASLFFPLRDLGNFEEGLLSYAQTAGLSAEEVKRIGEEIRRVAAITNQVKDDVLGARAFLVGKGMQETIASRILPAIGRAATATKAQMQDMAASGFAVVDNLKVAANEIGLALDAMNVAGKAGGFEIKDMAAEFPALTAAAQFLGMKGVPAVARLAAALQVARKGAGSSQEAANNMQNFLAKITSPEVVKKFASEWSVNIEKEMKGAVAKGLDPFDHVIDIIAEKTGGDPVELGKVFGDMQVQSFLKPMISNLEEYRRIRDQALGGKGSIDKDFDLAMTGLNQKMKGLGIAIGNLVAAGETLLPILKDIVDNTVKVVRTVSAWAERNPELASAIVKTAAVLMSLSIASAVAKFFLAGLVLNAYRLVRFLVRIIGLARAAGVFALIGRAAGGLGRALLWLVRGALPVVVRALMALATLAMAHPIIALVAAIAGAAILIYMHWDKLKRLFWEFPALFRQIVSSIPVLGPIIAFGADIIRTLSQIDLFAVGQQIIQSLWEGMKAIAASILSWAAGLGGQIAGAIKGAIGDVGVRQPGAGGGGGGGGWGGDDPPAPKARGGAYRAGQLLRVGEKGPELMRMGQGGTVIPNKALQGGRSNIFNLGGIHIHGNVERGAVERLADAVARRLRGALHDGVTA